MEERSNEIIAIPALLERWDLKGALVCIDAIGCNPTIADAAARFPPGGQGQTTHLACEIESDFATAPAKEIASAETLDNSHGRLEIRNHKVFRAVDWIGSERAFPGAVRFKHLAAIAVVETRTEKGDKTSTD